MRARLDARKVKIVSLGAPGLLHAVDSGEVAAAYVEEPFATELIAAGGATLLADLRSVKAAAETLDAATVHAAVFARLDKLPTAETLAAFTRAVVAAEARIVTAEAGALAARLAPAVSARPDEFAARLAASRGLFLPDATVSPEQVRASLAIIRERMPLPPLVRLPSGRDLVAPRP
jgi:ABC-type nitrate/sulfonate/bicarbonate transport system substrate-binding protein